MTARKTKVLVVDDSAVVRQVITSILATDRQMEVIAAVPDPIFAMSRMRMRWPDVIVLDVEMPRMDGITFLRRVMAERPTPVVICSTLTTRGAEPTMQALAAGAVTVVPKPRIGARDYLLDAAADLLEAVRAASIAKVSRRAAIPALEAAAAAVEEAQAPTFETTDRVVALGTSTGGTQALEAVLSSLPRDVPGILIVQHMPEKFTKAFAQRLDSVCAIEVREATGGDRVSRGLALLAPGGRHMQLRRNGAQYQAEISDGPPVNRHRPSVDVLFRSVARHAGRNALGVIMTGMGADGARGMLEMRQAGARTLAQDEESCVVYGMPMEAMKCGAAERTVSLAGIARAIAGYAPSVTAP